MRCALKLTEPVPVEDELLTGLSHIETVGDWGARLVMYHVQTCYEAGAPILVVKRKLVLPLDRLRASHQIVRDFWRSTPHGPPPLRAVS